MSRNSIGELEELILLVTGLLVTEAYGVTIKDEIYRQTGRSVNISAVHAVLKRLQAKGYVESRMGGASAVRGGRRKRFYTLTTTGRSVLEGVNEVRNALFDQLPSLSTSIE